MSVEDINRYSTLCNEVNLKKVAIQGGDADLLEKVFYKIYLEQDTIASDKFSNTLKTIVEKTKNHAENQKLSLLQARVEDVFVKKNELAAAAELKTIGPQAYSYAQEIAKGTFSSDKLIAFIESLNTIDPKLSDTNPLLAALRETSCNMLLDIIFEASKSGLEKIRNEEVFNFLDSCPLNQLRGYVEKIKNHQFSFEQFDAIIVLLNSIAPSDLHTSQFFAPVKEIFCNKLLEFVFQLDEEMLNAIPLDEVFGFITSFGDLQLKEIAQQFASKQSPENRKSHAPLLLKAILQHVDKLEAESKIAGSVDAIRLFCTLLLPLCLKEDLKGLVEAQFKNSDLQEIELLKKWFILLKDKEAQAESYLPLALALEQLKQISNKIANPSEFFTKFLQNFRPGEKAEILLNQFVESVEAGRKVKRQMHVRVVFKSDVHPEITYEKVSRKVQILPPPPSVKEAMDLEPQTQIKRGEKRKPVPHGSDKAAKELSQKKTMYAVPKKAEATSMGFEKLLSKKLPLLEIHGSKITLLALADQENGRKFLSLDADMIKNLQVAPLKPLIKAGLYLMKTIEGPTEMQPLLSDLEVFLSEETTSHDVVKLFAVHLISMIQNHSITAVAVHDLSRLFGAAILIRDHYPSTVIDFSDLKLAAHSLVEACRKKLTVVCNESHPEKAARPETPFQERLFCNPTGGSAFDVYGSYYQNRYVACVATLLLNSKGFINRYLSDQELDCVFPADSEFDVHAKEAYSLFKESDLLVGILQKNAKCPERGNSAGEWTVRSTLLLEPNVPISENHVRQTILATALSHWSQQFYCSCSTTATYLLLETVSLKWICEDFIEIIEKGKFERQVNGHPQSFIASAQSTSWLSGFLVGTKDKNLSPLPDNIEPLCDILFSFQDLRYGFSLVGITKEFLKATMIDLCKKNQAITIDEILAARKKEIETELEKQMAEQSIIDERRASFEKNLVFAHFIIGSTFEASLIRLWENTTMGLVVPPMEEFVQANTIGNYMTCAIAKSFQDVTKKIASDPRFSENVAQKLLQTVGGGPTGLESVLPNLNFKQAKDVDDKKNAIGKIKVLSESFAPPFRTVLSRFRFTLEPGTTALESKIHCKVWVKNGKFTKIESEKQFEDALKRVFDEVVQKMDDPASEQVKKMVTGADLRLAVSSYFTTFFSSTVWFNVGDAAFHDQPWDFTYNGIDGDEIFTAATARVGEKIDIKSEKLTLISDGKLKPEIFTYAKKLRKELGSGSDVCVAMCTPSHGFRFYPNRSLKVPEGVKYEAWIAEKERKISRYTIEECPKTIEKISKWALSAGSRNAFNIEKYIEQLRKDKPRIKLGEFLKNVYDFVFPFIDSKDYFNDRFHLAFIDGIREDKLDTEFFMYIGDPEWSSDVQEKTVSFEFLLYFNPLTKQWRLGAYGQGRQFFEYHPELATLRLDIFDQSKILKQPMEDKRLLVVKKKIRTQMHSISETFLKNFDDLEVLLQKMPAIRQEVDKIFSQAFSIKAAKDALKLMEAEGKIPKNVCETLRACLSQKEKQQKIINDVCESQDPPVDKLIDTLFMTGFGPKTPKYLALDGNFDIFRAQICELCSGMIVEK